MFLWQVHLLSLLNHWTRKVFFCLYEFIWVASTREPQAGWQGNNKQISTLSTLTMFSARPKEVYTKIVNFPFLCMLLQIYLSITFVKLTLKSFLSCHFKTSFFLRTVQYYFLNPSIKLHTFVISHFLCFCWAF